MAASIIGRAPEASGAPVTGRGYPKAVVITDGYADMTEEHTEALDYLRSAASRLD